VARSRPRRAMPLPFTMDVGRIVVSATAVVALGAGLVGALLSAENAQAAHPAPAASPSNSWTQSETRVRWNDHTRSYDRGNWRPHRHSRATQTPAPEPVPESTATVVNPPGSSTTQPTGPSTVASPTTQAPSTDGGAFPSAATTGVRAGTALTKLTGQVTLRNPGQILENVEVNGCITVAAGADNVTIRNVLIRSNDCYFLLLNNAGAKNLNVVDTEFDGLNSAENDSAVGGYNYSLARVNIHGTGDGAKLGDNVTVQDSFIHDLAISGESHNDGLQGLDGANITIKHNTIIVKEGATSAIILGVTANDSWTLKNISIDNNLLGGGALTVYGGYRAGTDPVDRVSGIRITNNRFTTQIFPKGGAFGPLTSVDPPAVTLSGNAWYDGPNKGAAVD
jgi:hypothetical protein